MGNCCKYTPTTVDILNNTDDNDIRWFNLDGFSDICQVIDVYDADTITVKLVVENKVYKTKIRLEGIDAAEIRTKNAKEKSLGILGRNYLSKLILGKFIWLDITKNGKFGRPLGTLYDYRENWVIKKNSLNDKIVEEGYGYYYNGKKKQDFEDWSAKRKIRPELIS